MAGLLERVRLAVRRRRPVVFADPETAFRPDVQVFLPDRDLTVRRPDGTTVLLQQGRSYWVDAETADTWLSKGFVVLGEGDEFMNPSLAFGSDDLVRVVSQAQIVGTVDVGHGFRRRYQFKPGVPYVIDRLRADQWGDGTFEITELDE